MSLNFDMYISVLYREKNEHNEKSKEVIVKGITKLDADKVRHCVSKTKVLDIL